jgi:hypothetical protein
VHGKKDLGGFRSFHDGDRLIVFRRERLLADHRDAPRGRSAHETEVSLRWGYNVDEVGLRRLKHDLCFREGARLGKECGSGRALFRIAIRDANDVHIAHPAPGFLVEAAKVAATGDRDGQAHCGSPFHCESGRRADIT